MSIQDARVVGLLVLSFFTGVLFLFLGCILWGNWWPMLAAFMFVLIPMPYLFFGADSSSGGSENSWADAGKFLTGFSSVGAVAIPVILYHAGKIAFGSMCMELAAAGIMGGTLVVGDYLSNSDSGSYYGSY